MGLRELCSEAAGPAVSPQDWAVKLYERAKGEQWSIDQDINWRDLGLEGFSPTIRAALARIYTHVQSGEVLALVMTARAVESAPQLWAKMFGATQVMDEARHVEFFSRVVTTLGEPEPVCPAMATLIEDLGSAASIDEILLGTQIILEGYAQCLFTEGARLASEAASRRIRLPLRTNPEPFLRAISDYVGRDESRHVAFGVLYLKERYAGLAARERSRLQDLGYHWSALLDKVILETERDLRASGVRSDELLSHVRRTRATHFRHIGFDT